MDPDLTYTATEWIQLVSIGALFGALGQAIRVIPGLKKAADEAAEKARSLTDDFVPSRLFISLLIGAVAGVLGAISLGVPLADQKIASGTIVALLGIGYSGADFIEAFMARHVPKSETADASKGGIDKGPPGAVG
jgi:hypothetical protein